MSKSADDTVRSIGEKLRRRGSGELDAADDVWSDELVVWRNGSHFELTVAGGQRNERLKAEFDVLRRAMPDFATESVIHVDESAGVIVEIATWAGHTIRIPGSAIEGELHRLTQCFIYHVTDGKISRVETFDDAAAGRRWNELMTHTRLLDLVE